jgi:hypothetical protein
MCVDRTFDVVEPAGRTEGPEPLVRPLLPVQSDGQGDEGADEDQHGQPGASHLDSAVDTSSANVPTAPSVGSPLEDEICHLRVNLRAEDVEAPVEPRPTPVMT